MDIAIVGLQNAGKTSLVRVLAVSSLWYACGRKEELQMIADSANVHSRAENSP